MTDFLYTDARWTEHFVEVSDPHKEGHHVRFYFEPPQVGLTDDEMQAIWDRYAHMEMMRAIEAALRSKNT